MAIKKKAKSTVKKIASVKAKIKAKVKAKTASVKNKFKAKVKAKAKDKKVEIKVTVMLHKATKTGKAACGRKVSNVTSRWAKVTCKQCLKQKK